MRLIDGAIDTEASVSDGGNIALHSQDLLLMLNQSSITSNANTERFKGNGGNISIGSAFIVADPASNNDITANAFEGSGGNVSIDSIGLFGIQPANQPISGISDITASSTLGVQGIVEINTPNLDPSQGLVELPTTVVDASRQINQTCPTGVTADELSRFVRSGRSGLPSTPTDPLTSQEITSEWYTPTSETPNQTTAALPSDRPDPLIEAQGWVKYPDGSVEMVAAASTSDPPSPAFISVSCHD